LHNTGQTGGTPDADVDAPEAWSVTTGSAGVVVALIDTGIDTGHPDLAANLWTNTAEIPGNGVDDDANGYVDDVHGINVLTGSGNPFDDHGHGTQRRGNSRRQGKRRRRHRRDVLDRRDHDVQVRGSRRLRIGLRRRRVPAVREADEGPRRARRRHERQLGR
jgi:hypothetical protein